MGIGQGVTAPDFLREVHETTQESCASYMREHVLPIVVAVQKLPFSQDNCTRVTRRPHTVWRTSLCLPHGACHAEILDGNV